MQIMHTQSVYKDFQKKNSGECHHLYVHHDTLLLADVLGVVRKLATCTFWLRQCKEKNMLRGCIQGPKTRNKL